MFKKQKNVVYKSGAEEEEIKRDLSLKWVVMMLCTACIVLSVLMFMFFPLGNKVELPAFYLNTYVWICIFGIILITCGISLMLVTNQGANKKVFIYFLLCGLLVLGNLVCSHIFHLFYVSLFFSAVLLYVAFLLFHELRKTNFTAYYLFIPFVLFSVFNVIIYYFIAMLN